MHNRNKKARNWFFGKINPRKRVTDVKNDPSNIAAGLAVVGKVIRIL